MQFLWLLYPVYIFAKFWVDFGLWTAEFFSGAEMPNIYCPFYED